MKSDLIKFFMAAGVAAVGSYFNQLIWPFVVLVLVMSVDYATGVHAAWVHDKLKSRIGLIGFLKKISYIAMVVVGCVCDYLMTMLGAQLTKTEFTVQIVGLTVICWLIINELLSILENIHRIGGPVPPFIEKLLQHLQQATEEKAPVFDDPQTIQEGRHERRD